MSVKRKIPMRQCIGCREMKSKRELLRILRTPEGQFVIDTTGKKNGRGAYLCISGECLQRAVRTKGLERSFQMGIGQEIYERLEKECFVAAEKAKGLERSFQCAVSGEIYKELLEELKHLEAE